ncbi:Protein phosphatase methylesterase 1 [Endocarpon pusillum Z07020]|uniref:Protein phosphatase methylesterase 1 n=1 Tax=Endocarpon pusillum (strain Z07020 / HMAS-L-300199) TaxID=1263415 RepID=U1HEP6_ENDPU|nr:Protein phosphatase methylesterase 1 [Endocarpon pusillum Z07020]ERF68540.1 Protein phosphatase methylesterase 1 [Endocarpon pusillum Z07020]
MSELQRSFAKAQLAKLPPEAPLIFDEREEDEECADDTRNRSASDSSASSTGTIVPSPTKHLFERPKSSKPPPASRSSPLEWTEFFETELYLERQRAATKIIHHAYFSPPSSSGPLFVAHHGAGSSGLSFACFAAEIRKAIPAAGVLSLDARGHGRTQVEMPKPEDDDQTESIDLSLGTLSSDLADVVQATQTRMSWSALPDIVLIGHSLGGAVVVDLAHKGLLGSAVLGYAVLDVVEGSAMEALAHMETYLSSRPSSFPSLASAIEWHTRSRTIRNSFSARVSVPSLLLPVPTEPNPSSSHPTTETTTSYTWRTPLPPTQPFWPTWFEKLSSKFLASRGAKLLLLAGTDRLDKELMIGQMQGKYQLHVFPDAGHFLHEDQPAKVAAVVAEFWRRNDRAALVLPPKVGVGLKGHGKGEG